MTGKQAAQTAKRGLEAVSAKSAAIFVVGGIAAIAAGKFIQGADWATLYGYAMGGWGILQSVVEKSAKRTGNEVTNQFFERLGKHEARIERGEEEHAACEEQHTGHVVEIGKLRRDVNEIAGAVGELKPGWKLNAGM